MSRKFRPNQCLGCVYYQSLWRQDSFSGERKPYCSGGGLGVIRRDDHPVALNGETSRPCPDYRPKIEEVKL